MEVAGLSAGRRHQDAILRQQSLRLLGVCCGRQNKSMEALVDHGEKWMRRDQDQGLHGEDRRAQRSEVYEYAEWRMPVRRGGQEVRAPTGLKSG